MKKYVQCPKQHHSINHSEDYIYRQKNTPYCFIDLSSFFGLSMYNTLAVF